MTITNSILAERYQIRSLLGRKTGRRTFLAQDLLTQENVVIKLMLFNPDFVWDDLKLFEREVEVLKSLVGAASPLGNLAAIPKYLDSFDADTELGKGFALVQTYIEARSLQDWIESGRTFSESEIKTIAKKLLQILDYLHHLHPSVIHRDLKPSNILLANRSGNSPGEVYLIDFGSVQTAPSNGTITLVGTYGYMPPEQFGGETSPASDLYALGATLIYLATGSHPSELPKRELRILFADRVRLSQRTIDWLKWLTEPSLDSRPHSAQACLGAIDSANLNRFLDPFSIKPQLSKITVKKNRDNFEIVIPPRAFYLDLISISLDVKDAYAVLGIIGFIFFMLWHISVVMAVCFGFFISPLLLCGLHVTIFAFLDTLFTLFCTVRFKINSQQISYSYSIFRLPLWNDTAARDSVIRLEVNSKITIWNGCTKFELGGDKVVTPLELDWLAKELSNWLQVPIHN